MVTCVIEMPSGIAGDMLLAALIDCGADAQRIEEQLLALNVGPLPLMTEAVQVSSISATKLTVDVDQSAQWHQKAHSHSHSHSHSHGDHHADTHLHRPYRVIRELLLAANLPKRVSARAVRVFRTLAEAEGAVHGIEPEDVIFHEVGGLDAIADVVGVCLALEQLGVERVVCGPILLGQGSVRCAHGRMPVPVPAVQHLVERHQPPTKRLSFESGEVTTPTGCSLALGLAEAFEIPAGRVQATGYGAGHKTIPGLANMLRVSLIEEEQANNHWSAEIYEIRAIIDDASPELLAATRDSLIQEGARDAWLQAATMKKGRLGSELVVLASPANCDRLAAYILDHTTTIGLRRSRWQRWELPREEVLIPWRDYKIPCKAVQSPNGTWCVKAESDILVACAQATGYALSTLKTEIEGRARLMLEQK